MRLVVPTDLIGELVRHAREALPEEGCGFLVGRSGVASRFVPAANALRSETAFAVEPGFLFDLFRELRASGEELVAIYHSHPKGPAAPSTRDVSGAHYPETAHIIVSLAGQEPEVRAYRIAGQEVLEMDLHAIV